MIKIFPKYFAYFVTILTIIALIIGSLSIWQTTKKNKTVNIISGKDSQKTVSETLNVLDVSIDQLTKDENGRAVSFTQGKQQPVTYNNKPIRHWIISPSQNQLGFLYDSGNYNNPCRDVALVILTLNDNNAKQIYEVDCKLSSWEWLTDEEVVVYWNCGTECMQALIFNTITGEETARFFYGVGYEWSPNKEMVVAYNYSAAYGISVGDKTGNELFGLRRKYHFYSENDLEDKTKALWSPDSQKLALIIRKEMEDEMELLVFSVTEHFKQIFQNDINFSEDEELQWDEDSRKLNYREVTVFFE